MKDLIKNMDMRTALLIQEQKSESLRAANDHNYNFFHRIVERVFSFEDPKKTLVEIDNLVKIANREPWSSLKFFIYDALGEHYAQYIEGNETVNPEVAFHISSILSPEPFVSEDGELNETSQLKKCINFDFILDMRREKIKQLQKNK